MIHKQQKFNIVAFTLIETLIIVVIIGILIGSIGSIFRHDNARRLDAMTCINEIYAGMSQHLNSAVTSKGIYDGSNRETPAAYTITIERDSSPSSLPVTIKLTGDANIIDEYTLRADTGSSSCYIANSYFVGLKTNISKINVQSGLRSTLEQKAITIIDTSAPPAPPLLTGSLVFSYCQNRNTTTISDCIDLSKITIDSRTARISKSDCLEYNASNINQCDRRS